MTRLSFKLRDDLGEYVMNSVLGADLERAADNFLAILKKVANQAGLTYDQYCELESAAGVALGDAADAAFIIGLLVGRDPLSLILQPAAGEEGAKSEGGDL